MYFFFFFVFCVDISLEYGWMGLVENLFMVI